MKNIRDILHWSAFTGYLRNADAYSRGRPGYPPEINDWLRTTLQIKHHSEVLDLGAGTGKFTQRLVDLGAHVTAVEPIKEMRDKFKERWPDIEVIEATAQQMPQVRSGSIDAVVCAHSFHWFATEEAMKEIHRVLKPGGRLGLIWNLRDASVDWVGQLAAIVSAEAGDNPRYYSGDWRKVFPYAGFSLSTEKHFPHLHTGSPEDVIINRIKSISFIASKTPEEQAVIFDKVRHLIATHPALANKESISVPYDTVAYHAAKILPL